MSHHHEHSPPAASERLRMVFWLNLLFVLIELAGGLAFHSLAILADALHDLGDCLTLALAWYFQKLSMRSRDQHFSYGYRRFPLLSAVINGLILSGGSLLILRETLPRFWSPAPPLQTPGMFLVALLGLVINGLAFRQLHRGESAHEHMISLHLLEDLLGWAAVLLGAGCIHLTHWYWLDPLLALLIAGWILRNAVRGLWRHTGLLLQQIPPECDLGALETKIQALEDVASLHDLHVWSLDGRYHVLTLHVVLKTSLSPDARVVLKQQIRELTHHQGIAHLTVELEEPDEPCELEHC
jgi:cobalt-zinc-cadmium efflux system protein